MMNKIQSKVMADKNDILVYFDNNLPVVYLKSKRLLLR